MTDRETDIQPYGDRMTERQFYTQTDRETDKHTCKLSERRTCIHRKTEKQARIHQRRDREADMHVSKCSMSGLDLGCLLEISQPRKIPVTTQIFRTAHC
ncbi:hypothetical protein DPMN_091842 [Dreissena polymorpha]|uniref:Uncharacterized protein n=1 Tax=Dreissena polymorpha TaxID=45954 RepID=A0A9D4L0K1_DREPO|nr:hypothetical protein DPMN_091842 [Dreissena polymorpha]